MAEYIEKGAAKYAVDLAMDLSDTEYDAICNAIDKAPSADVAPVVHGRWIPSENGGYYCSNCDRRVAFLIYNRYCPNCGAKMDGDGNG